MPHESVELRGQAVTAPLLQSIMADETRYRIEELNYGNKSEAEQYLRINVTAKTETELETCIAELVAAGASRSQVVDARTEPAPADGVFPQSFYSTTNLETAVRIDGEWVAVTNIEMDCGIVIDPTTRSAFCVPVGSVKKGQPVTCDQVGVRVEEYGSAEREKGSFEFMNSDVSSEKSKLLVIKEMAKEIHAAKKAGKKILVVGGPAIIHTGAGQYLSRLIEGGIVDVLFAGNALATHDIETALYGTSLGVNQETGVPVAHGHEHHIRAINTIRAAGSIEQAVQTGLLTSGVIHACVKKGVPYVLAGSIRDDGPLPGVITDAIDAQDAMRAHVPTLGVAIMVATTLHSIATGNMLPARVRCFCVDINPAVITKLSDRGTHQSIGLVTDTEPFFKQLAEDLGV